MKKIGKMHFVLGALGALLVLASHGQTTAQSALSIGGSSANFGTHSLRAGFMPDPKVIRVTSGGNLNVSTMGYGAGCRGFATSTPDAIVNYNGAGFLRFFVRASGDTTLVINAADGSWHCNDDSHGGLNPTVDFSNAPSGQYDVWIGSYEAGTNVRGTLNITELRSEHP